MTDAPLLEVDAISVRFGSVEAVRSVTLRIARGEIVAVLGANGAGKTTTLRAIARLTPLAAGRVRFGGVDVSDLATEDLVRRGVSLVPEGRAIFAPLTVRENLDVGAWPRSRTAIDESRDRVVALFPRLGERMRQLAGQLSGGEQQMLAIGRAMMAQPSLLLLDEPSLGVAPLVVRQLYEAITAIAASGVTVLLVEQNTKLALATSSRAYVLRTGVVALTGSSAELAQGDAVRAAYLDAS